jgi:hypothetical protein
MGDAKGATYLNQNNGRERLKSSLVINPCRPPRTALDPKTASALSSAGVVLSLRQLANGRQHSGLVEQSLETFAR